MESKKQTEEERNIAPDQCQVNRDEIIGKKGNKILGTDFNPIKQGSTLKLTFR